MSHYKVQHFVHHNWPIGPHPLVDAPCEGIGIIAFSSSPITTVSNIQALKVHGKEQMCSAKLKNNLNAKKRNNRFIFKMKELRKMKTIVWWIKKVKRQQTHGMYYTNYWPI